MIYLRSGTTAEADAECLAADERLARAPGAGPDSSTAFLYEVLSEGEVKRGPISK